MPRIEVSAGKNFNEDTSDLTPRAQLIIEIMRRCEGHMDMDNLIHLSAQLNVRFGGARKALKAIKAGKVGFTKCD